MIFRTSYLVGLVTAVLAVSSTTYFIDSAIAADTPQIKPLKIMGPDGQIRQVNHQYGPTTAKDTFWSIAQKVRPDASVSVYQVMAAVFDANPHAFNSNNYNSLERGMILLIPSKEAMLAIPNSVAIARAQNDGKQAPRTKTAKPAVKPAPSVTAPVIAEAKPKVETKTNVEVKPQAAVKSDVVSPTAPRVSPSDAKGADAELNARLDAAQSKTLSLTDELARAQDQLAVKNADISALKTKVDELNQQIAVLEEALQATKQQNQALKAEVDAAQVADSAGTDSTGTDGTEAESAVPDTPAQDATEQGAMPSFDELWRKVVDNPPLLAAAAVLPAALLLFVAFFLLRRKRNQERRELAAKEAALMAGSAGTAATGATGAAMAADGDMFGDLATHLDAEHTDDLHDLLDLSAVDSPVDLANPASQQEIDLSTDLFADLSAGNLAQVITEDDGQSLDDLWAEALGEQDQVFAEEKAATGDILEEDLDALLGGLSSDAAVDLPQVEDDAFAPLAQADDALTNFDMPEVNIDAAPIPVTTDVAASSEEEVLEPQADDIDALLASLDAVKAENSAKTSAIESQFSLSSDPELDLGDAPTLADTTLNDEVNVRETSDAIIEQSDAQNEDASALATPPVFETVANTDDDISAELDAELNEELAALGIEQTDDIDALLAEFEQPAEPLAEPDLAAKIASELDSELGDIGGIEVDDIDALLAGLDTGAALSHEGEIRGDVEPKLETQQSTSHEELDLLLADFAKDPIEDYDSAPTDAPGTLEESSPFGDTLTALSRDEIAAELEASLPEDLVAGDEDLDALLAVFDVPEQAEADAEDYNFDLETTHGVEPSQDDELLKGISAVDALDDAAQPTQSAHDSAEQIEPVYTVFSSVEATHAVEPENASGQFDDVKANKSPNLDVLDWDSEIPFPPLDATSTETEAFQANTLAHEPKIEPSFAASPNQLDWGKDLEHDSDVDLSDDSVLAAFTAHTELADEDTLTPEDSFALGDEHALTVDEALAALDAQESRKSKSLIPEHDLTHFQNEHGYIDIEKLLNDAEQDNPDTDLYPQMDVDMSEVGTLIGDTAMIDVDDEENSVNAKLDLARAYIEIEDSDSAKALLKEVQIDGNERQQEEAALLLKEIS